MSGKTLPNYLHVFEQRLGNIKHKLEDQLKLPKEKREKKTLVSMIKEAKKLRNLIREVKDEHGAKCPHCGKKI
jgi:DNA repair exonuclease SbcCD ATPase subunit